MDPNCGVQTAPALNILVTQVGEKLCQQDRERKKRLVTSKQRKVKGKGKSYKPVYVRGQIGDPRNGRNHTNKIK